MNHAQMAQLLDWLRDPRHYGISGGPVPLCMWSSPGVGKTSGVRAYCKAKERELGTDFPFLSYQPVHDHSGADLIGEKIVKTDGKTVSVRYVPPLWLPDPNRIETGLEPRAGVVFIDEPNRAAAAVRNGLMELYQEREIGKSGYKLPTDYSLVSAANYDFDGRNDVARLDDALLNRMVHVNLSFSAEGWLGYMADKGRPPQVLAFARNNVDRLPAEMPELPDEFHVPVTPRSFENLSCLYEPGMDRGLLRLIAQGLIGKELAADFLREVEESEAAEHFRGQLSAEHIMVGHWEGPLGADLAAGNGYHVQAVVEQLAHQLRGWKPTDEHTACLAAFLRACPQRIAAWLEADIKQHAPAWHGPVQGILQPVRQQEQEAARLARLAPRASRPRTESAASAPASTDADVHAPAPRLTAEHIARGSWEEPLAADLAAGHVESVHVAAHTLVAWLPQWEVAEHVVDNVARFLVRLPSEMASALAESIRERASAWFDPIGDAFAAHRAALAGEPVAA